MKEQSENRSRKGRSLDFWIMNRMDHCARCGSPLLPGDAAMRYRDPPFEFRHYSDSPKCVVAGDEAVR